MDEPTIQEDYCSFEVSRLLKEKKFEISTLNYYLVRTMVQRGELYAGNWNGHPETISCPSHALAIKWIRENFRIHIWLENNALGYCWKTNNASELPWEGDKRCNLHHEVDSNFYKKPEEATEAALLYTLQNLIQ